MGRYQKHLEKLAYEKELAQKVADQANNTDDGWMELFVPMDKKYPQYPDMTLKLPRIPFERWSFNAINHRASEWKNVAPIGLKMYMDNRDHTDWWLATGIPLSYSYGDKQDFKNDLYGYEPGDPDFIPQDPKDAEYKILVKRINEAAWDYKYEVSEKRQRGCVFLVSSPKEVTGRICFVKSVSDIEAFVEEALRWKKASNSQIMIAVVPDCSILYDAVIRHAGAIITQVGSRAAHLVKVAREDDIPVILNPEAFKVFFEYEKVVINQKSIVGVR